MRFPFPTLAWIFLALFACGFASWNAAVRAERILAVSALVPTESTPDKSTPTGFARGNRNLIFPGDSAQTYQWIAQTQEMLDTGSVRIRTSNFDNAPRGREIRDPALYRVWLGLVSWGHHLATGQPLGASSEHAALWADPLLQVIGILAAAFLAARRFGSVAAAVVALGFITLFPFNLAFVPGQLDPQSMGLVALVVSLLLFCPAAAQPSATRPLASMGTGSPSLWAGVVGGVATWVEPQTGLVLLPAAVLAHLAPRLSTPNPGASQPRSWHWVFAGAALSLAGWAIDAGLSTRGSLSSERVSLLHVFAWLAAGGAARTLVAWQRSAARGWSAQEKVLAGLSAVGVVLVLVLQVSGEQVLSVAGADPSDQLAQVAGAPVASNSWEWIWGADRASWVLITLLPLLAATFLAAVQAWSAPLARRTHLALLCSLAVAFTFAVVQLRGWTWVGATALVALALCAGAVVQIPPRGGRSLALASLLLAGLFPGVALAWPDSQPAGDRVGEDELHALIERDLAHWLSLRAPQPGSIVLASPRLSASLFYHGGFRTVASPYPENADGLALSLRISGSTLQDEAHAMIQSRKVSFVAVTSWDTFVDDYVSATQKEPQRALVSVLRQWVAPRWLRPIAYPMPRVPGLGDQTVHLYEVVEVQDHPIALGRLAEYFTEIGRLDEAVAVARTLEEHFTDDLGGLVARAQVAVAVNDADLFREVMRAALPLLDESRVDALPFDRRAALALALVQGERFDLARELVERWMPEFDETAVHQLTPVTLFRYLGLLKALEVSIPAAVEARLRTLLPPDARSLL